MRECKGIRGEVREAPVMPYVEKEGNSVEAKLVNSHDDNEYVSVARTFARPELGPSKGTYLGDIVGKGALDYSCPGLAFGKYMIGSVLSHGVFRRSHIRTSGGSCSDSLHRMDSEKQIRSVRQREKLQW